MKIWFAPMEGVTDGILRQAHNRIFGGVDVYCLPFHKLTQSLSLLTREIRDISPEENEGLDVLPQAITRDPEQLAAWLCYVSECGYACADLNLGCPSPTMTKKGRGSGLLRDPGYLRTFFDRVFASTLPVRLSVKTRIGYDSPEEWPALLALLADYPFDHVTVHARTTKEQYTGTPHPEAFALALEKGLPRPVYNGDLRTPGDVETLLVRCPGTEAWCAWHWLTAISPVWNEEALSVTGVEQTLMGGITSTKGTPGLCELYLPSIHMPSWRAETFLVMRKASCCNSRILELPNSSIPSLERLCRIFPISDMEHPV